MPYKNLAYEVSQLGKHYLARYPKKFINIRHTNHDIAENLRDSQLTNTSDTKIFLLQCYFKLPNFSGHLAKEIRTLFETHFQQDLGDKNILAKSVPIETIKTLGTDYLIQYPTPSSQWNFFNPHRSQAQANELAECIIKDDRGAVIPKPTYSDLWYFIIRVYETLEHPNGQLARSIQELLEKTFQFHITTYEAVNGKILYFPTGQIALDIRNRLNIEIDKIDKINPMHPLKTDTFLSLTQ